MRKVTATRGATRMLWGNTEPARGGGLRLAPDPALVDEVLKKRVAGQPRADGGEQRQVLGRGIDLDTIEQSLRAAWIGDMRKLTDLSRETIDTDPHLGATLNKRFGPTSTMVLEVTPATVLERSDAYRSTMDEDLAKEIADEVQRQLEALRNWKAVLRQMAWGTFDGRAAHEMVWRDSERQAGRTRLRYELAALEWIHPRRLSFGAHRELRLVNPPEFSSFFSPGGYALRDAPHKFMTFMPQLFGDYPEREGLGPRCLYWSFFKRFGERERMILIELFGKPWRWIELDVESDISDEGLEAALDFVENIPGNGWGGLPRGASMKVQTLDAKSGEAHQAVIDNADRQTSKLVLGQTGTTDGESMGLNSSQAKVMANEQALILLSDAGSQGETVESGPARSIVALNWGEEIAKRYTPGVALRLPIEDREADLKRLDLSLKSGLEIGLKDAYEISGFRQPDRTKEAVLRMETPAGAMPGAAPVPTIMEPGLTIEIPPEMLPAPGGPPAPPTPGVPAPSEEPQLSRVALKIRKEHGKYRVYSEDGDPMGGPYETMAEAEERLRQIEHHKGASASRVEIEDGAYVVYAGDAAQEVGRYATGAEAHARIGELEVAQRMVEIVNRESWHPTLVRAFGGNHEVAAVIYAAAARAATGAHVHADVRFGAGVCCARRPESVYGSLDALFDRGMPEMARASAKMGAELLAATEGKETASAIYEALRTAQEELVDVHPYARALERRSVHAIMLGAMDSAFEREHDTLIAPAKFARALEQQMILLAEGVEDELAAAGGAGGGSMPPAPKFAQLPFDRARRFFSEKKVLPKARFEQLSAGAKRRAFTIARMESQGLLDLAHAELGRLIGEGANLKEFRKFAEQRLESAGWVPASASHVETVFRTNVTQAHSVGRLSDMTQPSVKRERPYWQNRGVGDDRSRPTHKAVHGWVLSASDPFWERAFPGNYGFNCFTPETPIAGRIIGASKARYAGKVVELTTAEGRRLRVTPNHPVVTAQGVIRAEAIREGDYLICDRGQVGRAVAGRDEEQAPASAEDVFRAFAQAGDRGASAVAAGHEFHGEARHFVGEVEVVGSYGQLLRDSQAAGFEYDSQLGFVLPYAAAAALGAQLQGAGAVALAATSLPRLADLAFERARSFLQAAPFHEFRLGAIAELDVVKPEGPVEDVPGDAEFAGELLQRGPSLVALDQVVGVRQVDWVGHVYDFESAVGWIMAGGIAAGNCRCRAVSLSERQVRDRGLSIRSGGEIRGLPDPGFSGAGMGSLLAAYT